MEIEVGEPRPLSDFLEPAIEFPLKLRYNSLETPLSINGLLASEDGKVLTQLSEFTNIGGSASKDIGKLGARGTAQDQELQRVNQQDISLVAPLSRAALNHVDSVRDKNRKKDVVFKLSIKARILHSSALIPPLHRIQPAEIGPPLRERLETMGSQSLITYKYERDYAPHEGNLWLISGNNDAIFLKVRDTQYEMSRIVYASNWIHDFAPQLDLGRFVVAELPIPSPVAVEGEFAGRLNGAFEALQKMEEKVKVGEWTEVMEKSRPVAELLTKSKDVIESLLIEKHGYPEPAARNLTTVVGALFDYGSKFVKKTKDKELLPKINAEKEDAYLIYSLSVGLVNLLTQKIRKSESLEG